LQHESNYVVLAQRTNLPLVREGEVADVVADDAAEANLDYDDDGIGAACDCDADGDSCSNSGVDSSGAACPSAPAGRVDDRNPLNDSSNDADGDGIPDDCDPDRDNDGVPDEFDNCPDGDGDDVYEPGIDDDPDQADAGGIANGDLCDPLCRRGGPGVCGVAPGVLGGFDSVFPGLVGRFECLGGGGFCSVGAYLDCIGAEFDRCSGSGFDRVRLTDALGRNQGTLVASTLGFGPAGFAPLVVAVNDFDGDRVNDFAVGVPGANLGDCSGQNCIAGGAVVVISGRDAHVLETLASPAEGARFGAALAFDGRYLAVGAPAALNARGASYLFELGSQTALRATYEGAAAGDAFGSAIAALPGSNGFAIGAPGASLGAGRVTVADARGLREQLVGPAAGAGLSRVVAVPLSNGGYALVGPVAAPNSSGLAIYRNGALDRIVAAPASDELGAGLLVTETGELLAGAPGAFNGAGAVLRIGLDGTSSVAVTGFGGIGTALSEGPGVGSPANRVIYVGVRDYGGPGTLLWSPGNGIGQ